MRRSMAARSWPGRGTPCPTRRRADWQRSAMRALVAAADQLEQHAGLGLVLADIGDVVEDEQVILVELGDRAFEAEFAACDLQALDEFAGAHEQHAPSVVDESKPDGCREMALAGAGWAEQEQIGALFEPAVAGGERHHLRLADHRDDLEVEIRECLADRQTRFGEMALDAATAALRLLGLQSYTKTLTHARDNLCEQPTYCICMAAILLA